MSGRVLVVGGGLAGLAAALVLKQRGYPVEVLETRQRLGGRASSFQQPRNGELVDFCQHVSLGCCTNWWDFCQRAGIDRYFRRFDTLHFIGPDGERCDVQAWRGWPPPAHLAPALARFRFFSWRERWAIARGLWRLARSQPDVCSAEPTMEQWLADQRQPPKTVAWFWHVVLVSALGETLDHISLSAARKVFVDAFLSTREGSQVLIPTRPLGELYSPPLASGLVDAGLRLRTSTRVAAVEFQEGRARGVATTSGERLSAEHVIVAVPWRDVAALLPPECATALPSLRSWSRMPASGITGAHLWFDRRILELPHAVLVGRASQWVFADPTRPSSGSRSLDERSGSDRAGKRHREPGEHYVQVVISASGGLVASFGPAVLDVIQSDLRAVFPAARGARLLRAQLVTERRAVFSPTTESARLRPPQETTIPGLYLAGDWTATGWPATMESAVRSGYLAAEAILASEGDAATIVRPDLRPSWLARQLLPAMRD